MAEFTVVGKVSEFEPGKVKGFEIRGKPVAVVAWKDRFFAFANECTHTGVRLTYSYVTDADEIICLFHDSYFDMHSGKVLDGPAFDDLPVYEVKVEGDDVLVGTD